MKTVSISELRRNLPAFADAVARGEEIVVTRRGRAAMRLVPLDERPDTADEHPFRDMPIRMTDDFDAPMEDLWQALAE